MEFKARVVGKRRIRSDELLTVDHEEVRGADYSGRKLMGFTSIGSRFDSCRFEDMRIEHVGLGSGMEMSKYVDCSFDRTRILFALGHARFVRCSFRDVDVRYWIATTVELVDCVFTGRISAGFRGAVLDERHRAAFGRERNEFHGNDFSKADLVECSFMGGIDLSEQRLPSGLDYLYLPDAAPVVQKVRENVVHWEPGPARKRAMAIVRLVEVVLGTGQRQLLLRKSNLDDAGPVFELLRDASA